MSYRVNFERGNLVFEKGALKVNPNNDKAFTPDLSKDTGYYRELKYFIESITRNTKIDRIKPESALVTIKIAEAEQASADERGMFKDIK